MTIYFFRIFCFVTLLLPCLLLTGCGSGLIAVSGKITLEDGTPLKTGKVFFISGINQGEGTIQPDGTYQMSFKKKNDGIPKGSYRVLVTGAFFTPDDFVSTDDMDTGERPMIDPKYAETETSPLTCEVPGEGGYDFVVSPSEHYLRSKGQ